MRDLIITENITLDGVIDAAEGWFMPAGDEDTDQSDVIAALAEQREAADAFLTGRPTFEQMRGFWPQQTDDETGVSDYLNRVQKYVVSTTLEDPGWEPTTILRGLDDVSRAQGAHGADIVVTGSLTLVPDLIAAGWWTSTGCSSTRSSSAAGSGCSRTRGRAAPRARRDAAVPLRHRADALPPGSSGLCAATGGWWRGAAEWRARRARGRATARSRR